MANRRQATGGVWYDKGRERWCAKFRDASGRQWFRAFVEKKDAVQFRAVGTIQKEALAAVTDPSATFDQVAQGWFKANDLSIISATNIRYRSNYNNHVKARLGHMKVVGVNADRIITALREIHVDDGMAPGSVRYSLQVIKLVLKHAQRKGIISGNPARGLLRDLKMIAAKKRVKAMETAELMAFQSMTPTAPEFRDLLTILPFTGLRRGEGMMLTEKQIDLSRRRISVERTINEEGFVLQPKGNEDRVIEFAPELIPVFKRAITNAKRIGLAEGRKCPFILCTNLPATLDIAPGSKFSDRPAAVRNFSRITRSMGLVLKAAKLGKFTIHDLRHTFATGWVMAKPDALTELQQHLGHSSISVTIDTYGSWRKVKDSNSTSAVMASIIGNARLA